MCGQRASSVGQGSGIRWKINLICNDIFEAGRRLAAYSFDSDRLFGFQPFRFFLCFSPFSISLMCPVFEALGCAPVKFFSKLNNFFLGYFDPENIFFDNKNK